MVHTKHFIMIEAPIKHEVDAVVPHEDRLYIIRGVVFRDGFWKHSAEPFRPGRDKKEGEVKLT